MRVLRQQARRNHILILMVFLVFALHLDRIPDYEKGLGALLEEDYNAAFSILSPLAEEGHIRSQKRLGDLYFDGKGVQPS